jgi:hypothetical protein
MLTKNAGFETTGLAKVQDVYEIVTRNYFRVALSHRWAPLRRHPAARSVIARFESADAEAAGRRSGISG